MDNLKNTTKVCSGGECGQVLSYDEARNPIWIWDWSRELEENNEDSSLIREPGCFNE